MTERDSTYAAVDKAFQAHIGRLYDVLSTATTADIASGIAVQRFKDGLERARATREMVLACIT